MERILHGARVEITIKGKKVGHASDLNGTAQYENQIFKGLGSPIALGIETVGVDVRFTLGKVRVWGKDVVADGIVPAMTVEDLIDAEPFTILVKDTRNPDVVLYRIEGAKPAQLNFQATARGLLGENVQFDAIEVHHESEG